jgi:lipoprotein LprG
VLAVICALVTGCGGSGGSNGAAAEQATKLLARAKATVDATPSAHFVLSSTHVPAGAAALLGGEGSAARPGKFKGALKVSLAGNEATVEVISTDGKVYAKLPFSAGFAITDPAQFGFADPGKFMDPATGVSNLLVKATGAKLTKKSRIGSDVVQQVTASIPGSIVKDLLTSADPSKPVAATFSIVAKSGQLRRAVVTGPFFQKGVSSTFSIDLDRYGEKVDIRAPSTS